MYQLSMRESDALESELCVTELSVNTSYTIRGSSANKYIPKLSLTSLKCPIFGIMMSAQFVIN